MVKAVLAIWCISIQFNVVWTDFIQDVSFSYWVLLSFSEDGSQKALDEALPWLCPVMRIFLLTSERTGQGSLCLIYGTFPSHCCLPKYQECLFFCLFLLLGFFSVLMSGLCGIFNTAGVLLAHYHKSEAYWFYFSMHLLLFYYQED